MESRSKDDLLSQAGSGRDQVRMLGGVYIFKEPVQYNGLQPLHFVLCAIKVILVLATIHLKLYFNKD